MNQDNSMQEYLLKKRKLAPQATTPALTKEIFQENIVDTSDMERFLQKKKKEKSEPEIRPLKERLLGIASQVHGPLAGELFRKMAEKKLKQEIKPLSTKELALTSAEVAPFALGGVGGALPLAARVGIQSGIMGGSRIAEEMIKGEKPKEAVKKGAITAGLTAPFVGIPGAITGIAGKLVKSKISQGLGESATKEVIKKFPEITKAPKEEMAQITEKAIESIGNKQKELGVAVGEAKQKFIESGEKIIRKPLKEKILDLLKKEQVFPKGGELEKATVKRAILTNVLKEAKKINPKSNPKQILDVVDNIDDKLTNTYTRKAAEQPLTDAEKIAMRVRGMINEFGIKKLQSYLPETKKHFAEFKGLLNAENKEIEKALRTNKGMQSLLTSSLKEGRTETLKNLQKLDDLLPENEKFLDKTYAKMVEWNLKGDPKFYPSKPGILQAGIAKADIPISAILRGLKKTGVPTAIGAGRAGLIRGERNLLEE
jgi:hypothetical protein